MESGYGDKFRVNDMQTRLMLTRYRVTRSRVVESATSGGEGDTGSILTYEYDAPASNDEDHSAAVEADQTYAAPYRDFRGHAASRVVGMADGTGQQLATTTWQRQDDDLTGKVVGTMTMLENYHQAFESSVCGSGWTCGGNTPAIERAQGDNALHINDEDGNWNTTVERGEYVADGESVAMQFKVTNSVSGQRDMLLGLKSGTWGTGFNRFGIKIHADGTVRAEYCSGTTCIDSNYLLGGNALELDAWYVLALMRDETNGYWLRLWERDNPAAGSEFRQARSSANPWTFKAWVNLGNLWLDEYSAGELRSLDMLEYSLGYGEDDPVTKEGFSSYDDLQIQWSPLISQRSLNFEGGSLYLGSRLTNKYLQYDQNYNQYGSLTRVEEAVWDGSGWEDYRATWTRFYPNTSGGLYLVGLPATVYGYDCPVTGCDYGIQNLVSSNKFIYDTNTSETTPPSAGELTWRREFVCFADSSSVCYPGYNSGHTIKRYRDQKTTYDSYGNPVSVTSYGGYGENATFASTDAYHHQHGIRPGLPHLPGLAAPVIGGIAGE